MVKSVEKQSRDRKATADKVVDNLNGKKSQEQLVSVANQIR